MAESKPELQILRIKTVNWQTIIVAGLIVFYLTNFGFRVISYHFPDYGQDYLAFWGAGRVADEEGYSKIYDFQLLRSVQAREMVNLGLIDQIEDPRFVVLPAPYLAVFLVPFKFLSRVTIQSSLVIWWLVNILFLFGYLVFFGKSTWGDRGKKTSWMLPLVLVVFSYPVFDNFLEGQLNVFLMIMVGEFVRNAVKGKQFRSGLWLAGLLLKPQLLVIIVPVLFLMGQWKVLKGFLASSTAILVASWLLTGTSGMKGLWDLLTGFTTAAGIVGPQYMINWRMIGVLVNEWTHSSLGWVITAFGMTATMVGVIALIRRKPDFGTPGWLMLILGTFSATLAFTWHAHNHMAIIMLPLLLITSTWGLLSIKKLNLWTLIPPIAWVGAGLVAVVLQEFAGLKVIDLVGVAIPVSAFLANLIILLAVIRWKGWLRVKA